MALLKIDKSGKVELTARMPSGFLRVYLAQGKQGLARIVRALDMDRRFQRAILRWNGWDESFYDCEVVL